MLSLVIASVFKERRGIMPPNSSKRTSSGPFKCAYCLRMYPRAKQLYTSSQTNKISVLNCNCSEISHCDVPVLQHSFSLDITYIRDVYNCVYEFLGSVNSIYGVPILVLLAHKFMVLVGLSYVFIGLYYSYESLNVGLISNYYKYSLRMCVTFWLAISLLKQTFIAVVCNNVTNESEELSDKLQKLLLHKSWQPMTFINCKCFRFNF